MAKCFNRECNSREYGFTYLHCCDKNNKFSAPHIDKDLFSVFLLLDGDIDYVIEGKRLHINPGDVVLVSNNELHHSILREGSICDYILLMLDLDFFIKNGCTDFTDMVFDRLPGTNNIIPAETIRERHIHRIFDKLEAYTLEAPPLPVVRSVIVELLYNLNKQVAKPERSGCHNENIRRILSYIDAHVTEELSLDDIAKNFFLTKQYLCKTFKKNTGFTINKYIGYKRIVLVRSLYAKGLSISEACMRAGFGSYSGFYRCYRKIMNAPPRESLSDNKK